MVSLCATLLLDMHLSLAVAVLYSLLVFAIQMQYAKAERIPRVKVFRHHGPLYSGNAERFANKIRISLLEISETDEPRLVANDKAVPKAAPLAQTDGDLEDTILSAGYEEISSGEVDERGPETTFGGLWSAQQLCRAQRTKWSSKIFKQL
ncbi:hypothetical protein RvY_02367 [Ramazzottius varieornatus]|uniref:Uncharacterized protein n=1 Tax=Ramazzottius varieornatus TaxID=947166 RepID=A0A1D1URI8_RAMVA|nr:hypothetical protein RvY_02367 [Ramazzottius varieornatus]